MKQRYLGTAMVLMNIANGNKGAQEKAERIEKYLQEFADALIGHTLYMVDLESGEEDVEKIQSIFTIPPISG